MTHQENYNLSTSMIEELAQNGLKVIPELVRVILNNVMQVERSQYLQANAYERTEDRQGHANGYKPKTVRTRLGDITFANFIFSKMSLLMFQGGRCERSWQLISGPCSMRQIKRQQSSISR